METRSEFMDFFRDDDKMSLLSTDDRIEIFESILTGGDDITVQRLSNLCQDYGVENITVNGIMPLFDVNDVVYYIPRISGFKTNTPLVISNIAYLKADGILEAGYYYSFEEMSLRAFESDLSCKSQNVNNK